MERKVKFLNSREAAEMIWDGATLGVNGIQGTGVSEEIHLEVEKRFLETGSPRNLTVIHVSGIGDGVHKGLNHYAHKGLMKRIIAGHYGMAPKLQPLIEGNELEAYNFPQGVISQMFRDSAAKKPRTISNVGLGTFVDPDIDGGKINKVTTEDLVEKIKFDGKEYLAFKTQKIDIALIRGTEADEKGNISFANEPLTLEALSIAMSAKNNGGIVMVQVEKIVKNGTINPKDVKIPHVLVDVVVVVQDKANHMQSFATQFNEAFIRSDLVFDSKAKKEPLNERKIIARRAAKVLNFSKNTLNFGFGLPESIPYVLHEEGVIDYFTNTVEPGAFGGTPLGGLDFGCSLGPEAIIDQPYMFDFYDGGGIDAAFLGLAECDQFGNINVSKFGPKIAGCGGFINITQNANDLVYCGTFTAGGLKVKAENGKLEILQEGRAKKFVKAVQQITFSGEVARAERKKVLYVTERAVFELLPEGLTLIEIAPGIDLEKDILQQMEFMPIISKDLRLMDEQIFIDKLMGLEDYFNQTKPLKELVNL
ncbi:MAG: CoA-transferase [Bacillota bacterium]|nr:CoA-transferase [Bacillota bacterium]